MGKHFKNQKWTLQLPLRFQGSCHSTFVHLIATLLMSFIGLEMMTVSAFADSLSRLRRSVFKIQVVSQDPNYERPWKHKSTSKSSGTGFYIGNNQILTNAHVVANARYLTVQRDGDSIPEPAIVSFIAHDCDLAVITTKNQTYFKDMDAMSFGSLPKLRSPVSTIGFPTGGEQISITKGIVSRVGYRKYVHSAVNRHLLVQVDSAINSGNSGGPVVQRNKVVGVAFQSFVSAENTGYIIPTPVISRFLKDIEDGTYDGHVLDGLEFIRWSITNPGTQQYFGQSEKPHGVVLSHVAPWSSLRDTLKSGDLLLNVDGQEIGADGRIDFQGERVDFNTIYDLKQIGETVTFKLKRGTKTLELSIVVKQNDKHYYAGNSYVRYPKYYIYGGLIFTTLTRGFLKSWGDKWYRKIPSLLKYIHYNSTFDSEFKDYSEFVVLADRLPHAVNSYVDSQRNGVIDSINGTKIRSLQDLIKKLESIDSEFVAIEFVGKQEPAVLKTNAVLSSNKSLLTSYGIDRDRWVHGKEIDGSSPEKTGKQVH